MKKKEVPYKEMANEMTAGKALEREVQAFIDRMAAKGHTLIVGVWPAESDDPDGDILSYGLGETGKLAVSLGKMQVLVDYLREGLQESCAEAGYGDPTRKQ